MSFTFGFQQPGLSPLHHQTADTWFHVGVMRGEHHGTIAATHKLTCRANSKHITTSENTMLDALKSTLMIGSPIHSNGVDGSLWPLLLAAVLAAAALFSRVGRD